MYIKTVIAHFNTLLILYMNIFNKVTDVEDFIKYSSLSFAMT